MKVIWMSIACVSTSFMLAVKLIVVVNESGFKLVICFRKNLYITT